MVQKYQNEISPIFYYGISTKSNEKDLKIPILQPSDWKSPYWMTLYIDPTHLLFYLTRPVISLIMEIKRLPEVF